MASENVKQFTDANFEAEVLKATEPVLVDFWAEWCMPCRRLAPIIDELATDYAGKVKVGKLDTDSNHNVAIKFGIASIPTVLLFKNGEVVERIVGLRGKADFQQILDASV